MDLVENRYVGMKSRGVYDNPGGPDPRRASGHRVFNPGSGGHAYSGFSHPSLFRNGLLWVLVFSERELLQNDAVEAQTKVSGIARLKLFKGNVILAGRKSEQSLYRMDFATFEEDQVYHQKDAEGFIRLNGLRLKIQNLVSKK